jgi:hypothetical protein
VGRGAAHTARVSYAEAMLRALVIAAALAAGACRDARLAELATLRDEVCACKTVACGEEAMKRVPQEEIRSDHRAQKIARSMLDCLAKLYVSDRPSTDPDAEAPAPAPASGAAP